MRAPFGTGPTPTSACNVTAIPSTSKPAPRFADDAGTRIAQGFVLTVASQHRHRCSSEPFERRRGRAGVDRSHCQLQTLGQGLGPTTDDQPGRSVEHDDVAMRTRVTCQHPADRFGVDCPVASDEITVKWES